MLCSAVGWRAEYGGLHAEAEAYIHVSYVTYVEVLRWRRKVSYLNKIILMEFD